MKRAGLDTKIFALGNISVDETSNIKIAQNDTGVTGSWQPPTFIVNPVDGENGQDGSSGEEGAAGADGTEGSTGKAGSTGQAGQAGQMGKPGRSRSQR